MKFFDVISLCSKPASFIVALFEYGSYRSHCLKKALSSSSSSQQVVSIDPAHSLLSSESVVTSSPRDAQRRRHHHQQQQQQQHGINNTAVSHKPELEDEEEEEADLISRAVAGDGLEFNVQASAHVEKRQQQKTANAMPGASKFEEATSCCEDAESNCIPWLEVSGMAPSYAIGKTLAIKDVPTNSEGEDDVSWEREAYMGAVLESFTALCEESSKSHLGYPINMDYDFGALHHLQRYSIINAGDPFVEGNVRLHSRQFEVGVLDWFAKLWDMDDDEYWGYITSGGTEGNHHGILMGRELFPDAVLYTSKDAHYSIFKAARMFRIECVVVASTVNGEIDYADLERNLLDRKGRPAIVVANIGTTMKGAVDDVDLIISTLHRSGYPRDRFYIHCDGALFGLMLAFAGSSAQRITFKKEIDSVSISGHKFLGCPLICGVQMTRRRHVERLSYDVEYIASKDTTITGCRSGHSPIYLWFGLNKKGYKGVARDVEMCLSNARWLHSRLRALGIGAMLNPLSTTVLFERPEDKTFLRKWQIACQGNVSHVVIMPNISREMLEQFVSELIQSRRSVAIAAGCTRVQGRAVCIAEDLGRENCACDTCDEEPDSIGLFTFAAAEQERTLDRCTVAEIQALSTSCTNSFRYEPMAQVAVA